MIKLFTDSASYIPSDLIVDYSINVLPLTITINGKDIPENEISSNTLFSAIDKSKQLPDIKPLGIDYLYSIFEKETKADNKIVAIFISSKLNDTYKNAVRAKEQLQKKNPKAPITIIDSKSTCMQEGLAVLAAAEKISAGAWLEEVISAAQNSIDNTKYMVAPSTLKYLGIDGRITKQQATFGSIVGFTPLLAAKDGEIVLDERSPSQKRALEKALEKMKKDKIKFGIRKVVIHHIDSFDKAMEIAHHAEKIADAQVMIASIGPVAGARFGPGAIGVVYQMGDGV